MSGEIVAIIIFSVAAIILLLFFGLQYYFSQNEGQKSYSVSLNGQPTYSNYGIAALVDDSQRINIFGPINVIGHESITLSDMIGQTANITSTNIQYKIYPKSNPQNQGEPTKIQLSVTDTKPGLFQGLMMINDSKNTSVTSIPITLASDTVSNYAVIWILVGVFISLIFWEFLRMKKNKSITVWLGLAENRPEAFKDDLQAWNDKIIERQNYRRVKDYLDRRYSTLTEAAKITFLDILSVLFGMTVGFIGLLNNDYLTSILIITPESIIIFFGTGLGIGTLKELFDKSD
jgi:hypothetical protein